MPISFLNTRKIISLSGNETIDFLQGIISNDARKLLKNQPIYTALLSPQGKFLYDFFLIPWQEKIYIDVNEKMADGLLSRLKIYRLRSQVEFQIEENLCVAALGEKSHIEIEKHDYKIFSDPRLSELGYRVIGAESAIKKEFSESISEMEYEKIRLNLCVPNSFDMICEKSLLLEFGFEQLNGVDFSKGCYVGQEVTTRSKFRGQVRKSIYKIIAEENQTLPEIGTAIIAKEKTIGELRSSIENIGIALINNEDFESAINNQEMFLCGEKIVKITQPIWR